MSNQQPPEEILNVFNSVNFPSAATNSFLTYPVAQGLETFPNGIKFGDGTIQTTADISGIDISGVANPMTTDLDANDFNILNCDDLEVSTITLNTQSGALTELNISSQTNFGGNKITNLATPTDATDGTNKSYVDSTATSQAQAWSTYPAVQDVSMGGYKIESMAEPVASTDATTKNYVDSNFLLSSTAAATYETISNAAATYETIANAAATYETIANAAATYAPLASPALTGVPTAPTATTGTNNTQIATTAFVETAIDNHPTGGAFQPFFCNVTNQQQSPNSGGVGNAYMQGPKFNMSNTSFDLPVVFRITVNIGGQLYNQTNTYTYWNKNSYVSGNLFVWPGRLPSGGWSTYTNGYYFMKGSGGTGTPPGLYRLQNDPQTGCMYWEYSSRVDSNVNAADNIYILGNGRQIQFMCDGAFGTVSAGSPENQFMCSMSVEILNTIGSITYTKGSTSTGYVVDSMPVT